MFYIEFIELVTREAELLKAKKTQKKSVETKPKKAPIFKTHPDNGNEPFYPLGPKGPKGPKKAKTTEPIPPSTTTTTTTTTTTRHPDHNLQHSIDNCIDIYDKCSVLIHEEGMDCSKDDMELICEKSCGFCGK